MRFRDRIIRNLKNGDSKEVVRFAWLPKRIGNTVIWLESYRTLYAWIEAKYVIPLDGQEMSFTYGEWKIVSQQPVKVNG